MAGSLNALGRHLALVGFMGAGKSTVGPVVAERLGRDFVELDAIVAARAGRSIPEIFARDGEAAFRELEEAAARDVLERAEPVVLELGGGAVGSAATRDLLRARAFTAHLEIAADEAWGRVTGGDRPLARDRANFEQLHAGRAPVYAEVADATVHDADGIVLAAAGVHVEPATIARLGELVPGSSRVELVLDAGIAETHGATARDALAGRLAGVHVLPAGERAKSIERLDELWRAFTIDRTGVVVAVGGGCTTDTAGLAAATYMRGVPWVAVPTTLVGQVDAAIGGKTAIDLPGGKNLVGVFHWPARVVVDADVLATLPEEELRNGLAEVVKTGLLAGERVWELPLPEQVRTCAAFKSAVCLRDPRDRGPRTQLNLGHTFAHALEAAAGYDLPHGLAVALGLLAALRISGNPAAVDVVEQVLAPEPVRVDHDRAWAALARDKKAEDGSPRLVLLPEAGQPTWGVAVPAVDVRAALDELIVRDEVV